MPLEPQTQSLLPANADWAGVMILVIAGLFIAAAVIGIVARMLTPERHVDDELSSH